MVTIFDRCGNDNFFISGRAGRSVSFATESQRKIVREIVRQSRNPVKSRVVPSQVQLTLSYQFFNTFALPYIF